MVKKSTIPKQEENIHEIAIQIRDEGNSENIDTIATDGNTLKSFVNNGKSILNLPVYSDDPILSQSQNIIWVNDTEEKLKWSRDGVINEMILPNLSQLESITDADQLYAYLDRSENTVTTKGLSDINIPNVIADTFYAKNYNNTNNLQINNSEIRPKEGLNAGVYTRSEKQSTPATSAEGIVTFEAQGFKPFDLVDNQNGTHNVRFKGDITRLVSNGQEFFILETESILRNKYGVEGQLGRSEGRRNIRDKASLSILDENLQPVLIDVVSFSFDGVNTEIVFNTSNLKLSDYVGLEFLPKVFTAKVGGSGLGGTLDEMQIKSLREVPKKPLISTEGVFGHEVLQTLYDGSIFEKCNFMVWKHSPNKKYWIILGRYKAQSDSDRWKIWYSQDNLSSIQKAKDWYFSTTYNNSSPDIASTQFEGNSWYVLGSEDKVRIDDQGRFAFVLGLYDTNVSRTDAAIFYGKVKGEFKIVRPRKGASNTSAGIESKSHSTIAFEISNQYQYFCNGMDIDFESGLMLVHVTRDGSLVYMQYWFCDFDHYSPTYSGLIGYDNYFTVADYHHNYHIAVVMLTEFEGEKQFFVASKHENGYCYAVKIPLSIILKYWEDNNRAIYNRHYDRANASTSYLRAFCAPSDYELGTRHHNGNWMHEIAQTTDIVGWEFTEDKTLILVGHDLTNNFTFISLTDFGRTHGGKPTHQKLEVDVLPDLGAHAKVRLDFNKEPTGGVFNFKFSGDINSYTMPTANNFNGFISAYNNEPPADYIQRWLINNVSWIHDKTLKITGDFKDGFLFEFDGIPQNITIEEGDVNTLIQGGDHPDNNLMINGGLQSVTGGPQDWATVFDWNRAFNGDKSDWVARSSNAETTQNLNKGISTQFTALTALKKYNLYWAGLHAATQLTVRYRDTNSVWNTLETFSIGDENRVTRIDSDSRSFTELIFNTDGAIESNFWQVYVSGWDNTKSTNQYIYEVEAFDILESSPVSMTFTTIESGQTSQGGNLAIKTDLYRRNGSNIKTLVSSTNGVEFPAGASAAWITNYLNSTSELGNNTDNRVTIEGNAFSRINSPKFSRCNDSLIFFLEYGVMSNKYNILLDDYDISQAKFNLYLEVGDTEYTLSLKILDSEGIISWQDTQVYTQGKHVIQIDPKKFGLNARLLATSSVPNESDFDKVYFTRDIVFHGWKFDSKGGVFVEGDWENGFDIYGMTHSDVRFSVLSSTLKDLSLNVSTPTLSTVKEGHAPVFLKYDNDAIQNQNTDITKRWKSESSVSIKLQSTITALPDQESIRLDSGDTSALQVGDFISINSSNYRNRVISEIVDSTTMKVSPKHGDSSSSTYAVQFYDKDTIAGRNDDGQSIVIRSNHLWSRSVTNRLTSASTYAQTIKTNMYNTHGTGLIFGEDQIYTENSEDKSLPFLFKIPSVDEYMGIIFNHSYSSSSLHIQSKIVPRASGGRKIANFWTVPDIGRSDGQFPLRTLELNLYKNRGLNQKLFGKKGSYLKVSIIGMSGGYPDESNLIAESTTKLPLIDIPVDAGAKGMPFVFDNVMLTPSSQVCLLIEVVGLDFYEVDHDDFIISFNADNVTTGRSAFVENDNVWVEADRRLWFICYDHYMMITPHNHESGPNWNVSTIGGSYTNITTRMGVFNMSLGKVENNKYVGTYEEKTSPAWDNAGNYTALKCARAYTFTIEDNDQFRPPIIKDAIPLGVENELEFDKNLVFAHAFGYTPDGLRGMYVNKKAVPTMIEESFYGTEENYNFLYGHNTHFGAHKLTHDSIFYNRYSEYSNDFNYGLMKDNDFYYGSCLKFNGKGRVFAHGSTDFNPYVRDFCIEFEIKPTQEDLSNSGSNARMIFSSYYLYCVCLTPDYGEGLKINFLFWNNQGTYTFVTDRALDLEIYQRIKITRSFEEGMKVWINFTKDDETQWQDMGYYGDNSDLPLYGDGFQIGRYDNTRSYFSIGGYTEAPIHNYYGRIGYIKVSVGNDKFTYNALGQDTDTTSFLQPQLTGMRNFGSHILCYDGVVSGYNDVANADSNTVANMTIVRHPDTLDAKVNTNEYVMELEQKELTDKGREKTIRLDLLRQDDSDPAKVKGYLVEFFRK